MVRNGTGGGCLLTAPCPADNQNTPTDPPRPGSGRLWFMAQCAGNGGSLAERRNADPGHRTMQDLRKLRKLARARRRRLSKADNGKHSAAALKHLVRSMLMLLT